MTAADFDAVVAALDDVGDGSAGDGDVANIYVAEGEGSEGGQGGPFVYIHQEYGVQIWEDPNDGPNSHTFTITRYGGDTSQPLSVYVAGSGTGSDPAYMYYDYYVSPISFDPYETTKNFTVGAHDDSTVENDETFEIFVEPDPSYTAYTNRVAVMINDDEWRWMQPYAGESLPYWEPEAATIERPGYDATLDGYANTWVTVAPNSVWANLEAEATYFYSYEAGKNGGALFNCDSQTGEITFGSSTFGVDNHEWVSAALGYNYIINNSGPLTHTADVAVTYFIGVGGSYSQSPFSSGVTTTFTPYSGNESWAAQHPDAGYTQEAMLRCHKGPWPS